MAIWTQPKILGNTSRYSFYNLEKYNPFIISETMIFKLTHTVQHLTPTRTEYLEYSESVQIITNSTYFESTIDYNKTINEKYEISGMLIGIMRELKYANAGNLQSSLPFRNLGVSGRFTYAFVEYFSSLILDIMVRRGSKMKGLVFRLLGLVGILQKLCESFSGLLSKLELKATYGLVGMIKLEVLMIDFSTYHK